MPTLAVWRDGRLTRLDFHGEPLLCDALASHGMPMMRPCGGRGVCGKCAVELRGHVSAPNEAEERAGARLACQAVLTGDAEVWLPSEDSSWQVETGMENAPASPSPMRGRLGAAADVGTTTLALRLYELQSGACLATTAALNPQTAVAADVMGRLSAALDGGLDALRARATDALSALLCEACAQAGRSAHEVDALVLTGNTTMLYLLCGRDPQSLSRAPFQADCLFGEETTLLGRAAYLPPCAHAFVGADFVCAALKVGLCDGDGSALLCDVGTNGELGLWHGGRLYVASTAAGPAFEGAGISCGCGSVAGAIDRAWPENGRVGAHVIGGGRATGVCGSGLLDAIAAYLSLGEIDPSGAMQAVCLPLRDGVTLLPRDVRAVQLAKAAVAAGLQTLMESAGVSAGELDRVYLAGGFGSRLDVRSAAAIGLLPRELTRRAQAVGNAALDGAALLLADTRLRERALALSKKAEHVELGGNARFSELFMAHMGFESAE